jgi:hypothetical protein
LGRVTKGDLCIGQLRKGGPQVRGHSLRLCLGHVVDAKARFDAVLPPEMGGESEDRVDAAQKDGRHVRDEPLDGPDVDAVGSLELLEDARVGSQLSIADIEAAGLLQGEPVPFVQPSVLIGPILLAPPGSEVRIAHLCRALLDEAPDVLEPFAGDRFDVASHRGRSIESGVRRDGMRPGLSRAHRARRIQNPAPS